MSIDAPENRPPIPENVSSQQQEAASAASASAPQQAAVSSLRAMTYALPEARLTLVVATALAALWMVCSGNENMSLRLILTGGIGLSLGLISFFVASIALRRRAKTPRLSKADVVLFVLVIALACVPTVSSNLDTRVINAGILGLSSMVLYLVLSGANDTVALSFRGIGTAIARFFTAQLTHFLGASQVIGNLGKPKEHAGEQASSDKRGSIWLGLLAALAVLVVVLPLLADADIVFGTVVGDALSWLANNLGEAALRILRFLLLIALAFALLHSMLLGEGVRSASSQHAPRTAGSLTIATLLAVLDIVYFIFVAVQFVYLFGNTATPAMHGGYAEYARTGFFELVAVAVINLVVLAICMWVRADAPRSAAIDSLELVLVVLTGVVLASSLWRMVLYVQTFGLTYLRFLTFFGIAFIALCLIAGALRILVPRFPFFRVVALAGIACWLAFGFCGADARIAEHNVNAFLAGQIEEMDTEYLSSLSHGAIPALERLERESPEYANDARAAIKAIEFNYDEDEIGWAFWAFDCL